MTPEQAAAIALAFAALSDDAAAATDTSDGAVGLYGRPSWATIDDPRTWMAHARREALGCEADV